MKMWMMGYNDGGDTFNFSPDSFNGRKLRPLIPRPLSSLSPNNSSSSSSSSSIPPFNRLHTNDFFSQFHHMATVTDQSKRELNNAAPVVVSSRWNPTPEQLRVLEELYRRGTRTPSAEQIQHITAQLRRYGKIEGKNVFYWFQNHKARERQKRRRQMESAVAADNSARELEIIGTKDSGLGRTAHEVEQTKNWPSSTNCTTLPQESVPIQRAAKASVMAGDCRTDNGWIQFEELHQRRNNNNYAEKNNNNNVAPPSSLHRMHSPAPPLAATATSATVTTILHKKSHNNNNNNEFATPFIVGVEEEEEENSGEEGEGETLQLFPLCSDNRSGEIIGGKTVENSGMNSTNLTPLQFFEFLPLKN